MPVGPSSSTEPECSTSPQWGVCTLVPPEALQGLAAGIQEARSEEYGWGHRPGHAGGARPGQAGLAGLVERNAVQHNLAQACAGLAALRVA